MVWPNSWWALGFGVVGGLMGGRFLCNRPGQAARHKSQASEHCSWLLFPLVRAEVVHS